jgi:hypothetical protein
VVSAINASISSLLAAGYSQLGQAASIQQIRADEIANKARLQAAEAEKAQQTVLPVSRDGRSPYQGQGAFINLDQRQQTLSDLLKPKADISPSDEAQLFAAAIDVPKPEAQTIFEQASDGIFYAVNDNAAGRSAQAEAAARRNLTTRQQQVADLYQRNFNAQFVIQSAYTLAA